MLLIGMALGAPAHAYNLDLRSDNPLVPESDLRELVIISGRGVPHNIPDSQRVYVHVQTRAKSRVTNPGEYLFYNRIELRRHFRSDEPYIYNGWLPIYRQESYGIEDPGGVKAALESTLRRFFDGVKDLGPAATAR